MQFRNSLAVCLATAALVASTAASAEYVTNGGFETGDFTGWTQFGCSVCQDQGVDQQDPQSGLYGAFFGESPPAGIFQTLTTTPGATYNISFWLHSFDGSIPNSFMFDWGGVPELALNNIAFGPYTQYTFALVATGPTTDLRFTFSDSGGFLDFDNVSVVPEPGTLALVTLAGSLVGFARRRRTA